MYAATPFLESAAWSGAAPAPPAQPLHLASPYLQGEVLPAALGDDELGVLGRGGQRRAVADTQALPFRWICRVRLQREVRMPSGRTTTTGLAPFGSGTLISPCHVLTAAHVLYGVDRDSRGSITQILEQPQTVRVEFGLDASGQALLTAQARTWHLPVRWKPLDSDSSEHDYALIVLDKPVATTTLRALGGQALGCWGGDGRSSWGALPADLARRLLGARVFTAGYPHDGHGEMRCAAGVLSTDSAAHDAALNTPTLVAQWARLVGHKSMTADATRGQSGSPVWLVDRGHRHLVGVVVTAGERLNGVRALDDRALQQINAWIGPPPRQHESAEAEAIDADAPDATEAEDAFQTFEAVEAPQRAPQRLAEALDNEADDPMPDEEAESEADAAEVEGETPDAAAGRKRLLAAIAAGEHDPAKLTNLLFFARHPDLDPTRPLQPKASKQDAALASEWSRVQAREVWPALAAAAEDTTLGVHGSVLVRPLRHFFGATGRRFKQMVEVAAQQVGLDPGLLAAALVAETGGPGAYLTTSRVSSYLVGVDDFYAMRHVLAKDVPAYAQVGWNKKQQPEKHLNDAQTQPREVQTIRFDSGRDALLATAVYLKYAEVRLRDDARQLGGDFDTLPVQTQLALVRMSMAAGRAGAATRLARALKGEDILVRDYTPAQAYRTNRNATIRAAEAMLLSRWVFGAAPATAPVTPTAATPQPELELQPDLEEEAYDRLAGFSAPEAEDGDPDHAHEDDAELPLP